MQIDANKLLDALNLLVKLDRISITRVFLSEHRVNEDLYVQIGGREYHDFPCEHDDRIEYHSKVLGLFNRLLAPSGLVLVAHVGNQDDRIDRFSIRSKSYEEDTVEK